MRYAQSRRTRDHNDDLKHIFKCAAIIAAKAGPFQEFYAALVAKGIRPEMARLTLARKIAAITLTAWCAGQVRTLAVRCATYSRMAASNARSSFCATGPGAAAYLCPAISLIPSKLRLVEVMKTSSAA